MAQTNSRVAIIGGGLSGLHAGSLLASRGVSCALYEGRPRLGGRALSATQLGGDVPTSAAAFDLGPAWFWPAAQPRIARLVRDLGLVAFPQYATGAMRVERFRLETAQSFIPAVEASPDTMRIRGGVQSLVAALGQTLPPGAIHLSSRVTHVRRVASVTRGAESAIALTFSDGQTTTADAVVLALPPRLIARRITFDPPLPEAMHREMVATPTWMAPHAKLLAIYDEPFWRSDGLSGMASSSLGPMQEIHDASPESGYGALVGFVGISPLAREKIGEANIRDGVVAQLVRLFGARARTPIAVHYKDWALDTDTTTSDELEDAVLPHGPGTPLLDDGEWGGRLLFAGAEVSDAHPGYMEGALLAAERAVGRLAL